MGHDSDIAIIGRAMKRRKKERHAKWHEENMKILKAYLVEGIEFCMANPETALFRQKDKPKVDFYPSTGRWKVGNKMFSGGARKFLQWYNKQGTNNA